MPRSHLAALCSVALVAGCTPEAWGIRYYPVANTASLGNAEAPAPAAPPEGSLVVFVDGSGGRVTVGVNDDAPTRVSSTLLHQGLSYFDVPAFEGTAAEWQGMMTCAAHHFAGMPISLVDQRPATDDHLLIMVGGTARDMSAPDYWGIASTGVAAVVERGVGYVFSAGHQVEDRPRHLCETLTHEIGHILGLNHVSDCRDLMSIDRSCAHQGFMEETRTILATSLAKWGPSSLAPVAPPVEPFIYERLTGYRGEPSSETGLYPELRELQPVAGTRHAYWPVSLTTPKPVARAVLHVVLPGPYVGQYHCSTDGSGCVVQGNRIDGSYPVSDPGEHYMLIEVFYADGEVRRTPWHTMTKP